MSAIAAAPGQASPPSILARARRWWLAQARQTLRGWSGDPLRGPGATLLVLRPGESDVEAEVRKGDRVVHVEKVPLGTLTPRLLRAVLRRGRAPRRAPVVIEPPPGMVLSHAIALPSAAIEALPTLVDDLVRRKTPVSPDRFHIAHTVRGDAGGADKALLRLALVPREWAAGQLARMGLDAKAVTAVMVEGPGVTPMFAPLAPPAPRRGAALLRGLAVLTAVAAAVWLGWSAWQLHTAATGIEARLAAVAPQAREAMARSRASGDTRALVEALAERRAQAGPIAVWRELTALMPADTFIVEVQIGDRDVTFSGYSSAPAALIPLLEASRLFKEAAFTGAVVFDPQERRERFSIRAALRHPQPAPETLR